MSGEVNRFWKDVSNFVAFVAFVSLVAFVSVVSARIHIPHMDRQNWTFTDSVRLSRLNTYIGDTRGKIAILLEARRWLHVSYLLPQMLPLDSRKDEARL